MVDPFFLLMNEWYHTFSAYTIFIYMKSIMIQVVNGLETVAADPLKSRRRAIKRVQPMYRENLSIALASHEQSMMGCARKSRQRRESSDELEKSTVELMEFTFI